jgi:radical SAM superfamily enzyme YgiQ (UPF0313 family)
LKVTFIYPDYFETQDIHTEPQGRVYLGIGYLSAFLRRGGHETELIHLVRPETRNGLIEAVSRSGADLVALSATTLQFGKVRQLAAWVKEDLGLPVICGGVHPTTVPEEVVREPAIDYICVGEGEESLLELCDALQAGRSADRIAGIWSRNGDAVVRNAVRPLLEDLDALPFPDRDIFDSSKLAVNQKKRLSIMAARGCPFNCSYCCNHLLKSIYPNPQSFVRFRSPDNVIEEIAEAIARNPGLEQVRFEDDILVLDRRWFRQFAALYRDHVRLPFICNARVDLLDEEMVSLLAAAGCSAVAMGIESGNAWLRRNVLNRNMADDKIRRAFELCREYGIDTVSLNMTGFPHETLEMALDTVKMNALVQPGLAQVTALVPFPNTRIFKVCADGGMLGAEDLDTMFSGRSSLKLDGMTREQVNMVCENFVLLMVWYRKLSAMPGPLGATAVKLLDWFLSSRAVPSRLRERVLENGRVRLDWKYYIGIDY